MRAPRLIAALVVAALFGSVEAAGITFDARNGDKVLGSISADSEFDTYRVTCPKGAKISAKAQASKALVTLSVDVFTPSEASIGAAAGKKVAVKATPCPVTGVYSIVVRGASAGKLGDYTLTIGWKSPASFTFPLTMDGGGAANGVFAADANATATITVKPKKRTAANPQLASLDDSTGPHTDFPAATKTTKPLLANTADYLVGVIDAAGAQAVLTVKVKQPKAVKRTLLLTATAVPDGTIPVAASVIGPGGGLLSVESGSLSGASVSIPPGALGSQTSVLIGNGTGVTPTAGGLMSVGPAVFFGPEGLTFKNGKTASITIPFDPGLVSGGAAGLRVFVKDAQGNVTEILGVTIGADSITLPAAHFSEYEIFGPIPPVPEVGFAATDAAPSDYFGGTPQAVGNQLAISGTTILVGSPLNDGNGTDTGAAYVFNSGSTTVLQAQKIVMAGGAAGDQFGAAVAVDGGLMAIGAYARNKVIPYFFDGSKWVLEAFSQPTDTLQNDLYGLQIAISGDTMAVGCPNCGFGNGAVYVYRHGVAAGWALEQKLTVADTGTNLGYAVALDGDTIVAGAPLLNAEAGVLVSGGAYVFTRTGTTWSVQQRLVQGGTAPAGTRFGKSGTSVALKGDTAVLGSPYGDQQQGPIPPGHADVFTRSGTTWSHEARLTAPDGMDANFFGFSVGFANSRAIVGARSDSEGGTSFGAAYVYRRTGTAWALKRKLKPSDPAADLFGFQVAIDSTYAVVSAPFFFGTGVNSGKAYRFDVSGL